MRADRVATLLPGVRRDAEDPDTLHIDRRVARWFALQFFHLLGYRSMKDEGDHLAMKRRRFDEARFLSRGPTPEHLH